MNHDAVHVHSHDITWFYVVSYIAAYDFFNDCLSHSANPPVRLNGAWL